MLEITTQIILLLMFMAYLLRLVRQEVGLFDLPEGMPPGGYPPDVVLSPVAYAEFCRDVVASFDEEGREPPVWALHGLNEGRHLLKEEKPAEVPVEAEEVVEALEWAVEYKEETFITKPA